MNPRRRSRAAPFGALLLSILAALLLLARGGAPATSAGVWNGGLAELSPAAASMVGAPLTGLAATFRLSPHNVGPEGRLSPRGGLPRTASGSVRADLHPPVQAARRAVGASSIHFTARLALVRAGRLSWRTTAPPPFPTA